MEQGASRQTDGVLAIPKAAADEIETLSRHIDDYRSGALSPEAFKACRLQMGIYGIRALRDRHMVRIKVPAGRLSSDQLERVAEVTELFATGRAHATTRQDFQLYEVALERIPELLRRLAAVGLTTREACGNSVRNVTGCPFSGFCPDELFDISPYARAISAHFLRHPLSQSLPRKFKISLSGCREDCAMAPIHDIGIIAAAAGRNGGTIAGFTLYVGGGLGSIPKSAQPIEPFTSAADLLPTCEAVVRVFDRNGERKNRQRARLKFLIERIGFEEFRRLVIEERSALLAGARRFAPLPQPQADVEPRPAVAGWGNDGVASEPTAGFPSDGGEALRRWLTTNVRAQKQPGFWTATVRLPLGDLDVRQMRELARLSRWCSQGSLILTPWQDLCLPWVESPHLKELHQALVAIDLALPEAQRIQDITTCPGADTCQIGITSSRGLSRALTRLLEKPEYQSEDLAKVRIKISGCPNSCGQHHIADIGLFGLSRQINGRPAPYYQLLLGGGFSEGRVRFGVPVTRLPAKRVPAAIERLLVFFRRHRHDQEPFGDFIQRVGVSLLKNALEEFTQAPEGTEEELLRDWGKSEPFSLGGMGQGECAG